MRARDLILSAELGAEEARGFLARFGFRDPERADERLQSLARASGAPKRVAELLPALLEEIGEAADPDAVLPRLEDVLSATHARNLLSFLLENRQALGRLARLLGASGFLARTWVRYPEYLYWIIDSQSLDRAEDAEYFRRESQEAVRPFETAAAALEALRRFRRRESLRIASQEILRLVDLPGSISQISDLADAVLQRAFELTARDLGMPLPRFAVMGMGKLGGRELNFSSDVDLVYVYHPQEDGRRMLRFARRLTQRLTEASGEGRLYRVDLRLRPMGRTGEIAYSLEAFGNYFQTWADTADRLAFIKCRAVAGDEAVGARFAEMARDFVYRRYVDLAAVEEVRWLKKRGESQEGRDELGDVKLGAGGIRAIEFFVQAFQLLHGGDQPDLRSPHTLKALSVLVDRGFIDFETYRHLREAYRFLRLLEHKLQLAEDRQTHSLPADPKRAAAFAKLMGLAANGGDKPTLQSELRRHRQHVKRIYAGLFEDKRLPEGFEELLLNPELRGEKGVAWLEGQGVEQAAEVHVGIRMLASASAFPHSPGRLRNLVANLAPSLVESAGRLRRPRRLFTRLDRLGDALESRTGLYQRMVENRDFSRRVQDLLCGGEGLCETLIAHPRLVNGLRHPADWRGETDEEALRGIVARAPDRNALRRLIQRETLKLATLELEGLLSNCEVRRRLSALAEAGLEWAVENALEEIPELRKVPMALLALGKLGGRELTYHSDLDLVVVHRETDRSADMRLWSAFEKHLRASLQELTSAGRAFSLDFRLRPEGRRGAPAISASSFRRYFSGRAEVWERVAYAKARPVVERNGFPDVLGEAVWADSRPLQPSEIARLRHLRRRQERELSEEDAGRYDFKVGPGGLMDISFVVQRLQLEQGVRECNTQDAIKRLRLARGDASTLSRGLAFLHRLEAARRLSEERPANSLPRDPGRCRLLAHYLERKSPQGLLKEFLDWRQRIRAVYRGIFPPGNGEAS